MGYRLDIPWPAERREVVMRHPWPALWAVIRRASQNAWGNSWHGLTGLLEQAERVPGIRKISGRRYEGRMALFRERRCGSCRNAFSSTARASTMRNFIFYFGIRNGKLIKSWFCGKAGAEAIENVDCLGGTGIYKQQIWTMAHAPSSNNACGTASPTLDQRPHRGTDRAMRIG